MIGNVNFLLGGSSIWIPKWYKYSFGSIYTVPIGLMNISNETQIALINSSIGGAMVLPSLASATTTILVLAPIVLTPAIHSKIR
jgi:hypothetical protein